jgi:hypothetical protein
LKWGLRFANARYDAVAIKVFGHVIFLLGLFAYQGWAHAAGNGWFEWGQTPLATSAFP